MDGITFIIVTEDQTVDICNTKGKYYLNAGPQEYLVDSVNYVESRYKPFLAWS